MEKLLLKLQNCYGINKLECELDFSRDNTIAIYAPNGVMKTSFGKTFRDIANSKNPVDLIYPENDSIFEIIDNTTSNQILAEEYLSLSLIMRRVLIVKIRC